ncbi:MAG: elongation factor [Pseudonocardiales bacterium]|nr:elongation factor [Pseudonocardiales bacterium]
MSSKTATRTPHARPGAEQPLDPARIRNVALVGHSGVGKTTLVEQLLVLTGAIGRPGTVADGTTASDSDPVEFAQQRSVFLATFPIKAGDVVVNVIDTPGFADFIGELRAGLRAADAALFVVSAADQLDETTRALWEECAAVGMPRAVVVNRLDAPRADLAYTLQSCRTSFGEIGGNAVLPLYLPSPDGTELIDLLSSEDPAHAAERSELIEAIIAESEDESLLDRYLGGDAIDPSVLMADLHTAVGLGHFHPVVAACAGTGLGLPELLRVMVEGFGSPLERRAPMVTGIDGSPATELSCDPSGPLAAEIVRTWVDSYLGRVSLIRMFSGTITADTPLHVSGHGAESRGHPDHDADFKSATLLSSTLEPTDLMVAGDICVVARLSSAETGDTISSQDQPLLIEPWVMPEPLLPLAVRAANRNDEDALAKSLSRVAATDPGLRIDRNAQTGQLVLWCLGEAHADVVLTRLRSSGAQIDTEPVRVGLLATFAGPVSGHGRQVKQSGGHGQYAVCDIDITPLPRGSGVEFADKVVGGAVPSQYISSVEKGARAQLALGINGSVPVTDVRVTLTDGKSHSVDSSDAAFQAAAALAIRDAATRGAVVLLEPIDDVEIVVGDEHIGSILSDLSGRRARVTGTEPLDSNRPGSRSIIHCEIPAVELLRYPYTLRSLTGGAGTFRRSYLRHDPAPPAVAAALTG